MLTYLDVCAGISASTVAWKPLGWRAVAYSEVDAAPRAVLAHHYPDTPLHGDFTTIGADDYGAIDLLVGGTPCQDFSVAGLRAGLDGDRGNLSLEFLRLADRKRPRWIVWENVPGVLSIDGGRAFGAVLGGLAQLGYGFAYRILDAQFFGVPQRRRRVFVVAYLGDWRCAGAVLFERESLHGYPPARGEARKIIAEASGASLEGGGLAPTLTAGGNSTGGHRPPGTQVDTIESLIVAGTVSSKWAKGSGGPSGDECHNLVMPILEAGARTGVSTTDPRAGSGIGEAADPMFTLQAGKQHAVAFTQNQREEVRESEVMGALSAGAPDAKRGSGTLSDGLGVRRITPRECERLQGFPDDYTLIPYRNGMMSDGPRYKMLGNSMAVPVMAWIGHRIQIMEQILRAC